MTITTPPRGAVSHRRQRDDIADTVSGARAYFDGLGLSDVSADELDPTIQDSDGLVTYLVTSTNKPPDSMNKLYEQISPVMEGLTNVVSSAVLKLAGTDDAKKHDPKVWQAPMQAMTKAFCGGMSLGNKSYDQSVRGVEVATKFLNIVMEAAVSQGAAFADFVAFLNSQGEAIRLEVSESTQTYLYASVSVVHELFEASDGRWLYVPKFKSYFTSFSQETLKISSSCASYNQYRFKFDLQTMAGAFMVDSWQSSAEFKAAVKKFIADYQKVNIADSANYFKGIFESTLD